LIFPLRLPHRLQIQSKKYAGAENPEEIPNGLSLTPNRVLEADPDLIVDMVTIMRNNINDKKEIIVFNSKNRERSRYDEFESMQL